MKEAAVNGVKLLAGSSPHEM